jgi:hypothetical protein
MSAAMATRCPGRLAVQSMLIPNQGWHKIINPTVFNEHVDANTNVQAAVYHTVID